MGVGDYVRTKDGSIDKIKYIDNENNTFLENYNKENNIFGANSIIKKSSPQIIDLIEVGDYVNGYKVIEIAKGFKILVDKLELDTTTGLYHHKSIMTKNIKTIITHEQMEAMQYRVEE